MKKLTQAVFDGAPDWVRSAAVDSDGEVYWYSIGVKKLRRCDKYWQYMHDDNAVCDYVDDGFDTTDWQLSAIDREY